MEISHVVGIKRPHSGLLSRVEDKTRFSARDVTNALRPYWGLSLSKLKRHAPRPCPVFPTQRCSEGHPSMLVSVASPEPPIPSPTQPNFSLCLHLFHRCCSPKRCLVEGPERHCCVRSHVAAGLLLGWQQAPIPGDGQDAKPPTARQQ